MTHQLIPVFEGAEMTRETLCACTSSGRISLQLTLEDARSACHQGPCDDDVAALMRVPYVRVQLRAITPSTLRLDLKEYGAWDADELADHDQNLARFVWLMAGDIVENDREDKRAKAKM